ncbi:exosortase E/protease, VPEID-CTERM system [Pseudoroseicyclus sp. CXY001]|uniref:exosortase E/protease, VPEID-CTERM system n=1 Tax=Pseudoroseicyclus sp. CXY001 TaxID=3242492 RepID=UPI0035717582
MMRTASALLPTRPWPRLGVFGLLALIEIGALAVTYQVLADFECTDTGFYGACRAMQSLPARALVVLGVVALIAWARPAALRHLGGRPGGGAWALLHLAGLVLMFLPAVLAPAGDLAAIAPQAMAFWAAGGIATALGWLFWLAAPRALADIAREVGWMAAIVLLVALVMPDLVRLLGPIWNLQAMASATLHGAAWLLELSGEEVMVDAPQAILATPTFAVRVAETCSGIEGVALVLAFGSLYAGLFRKTIHLGRFFALVLPLAMLASWLLNMLRIAVLVKIGANGAPDLAVGGFHSHAGWIFFCLVALGLVALMETIPWLHKGPVRPSAAPRWTEDRAMALILPFVVFMLTGLIFNGIFAEPEIAYPIRIGLVALTLWPFRRLCREMMHRPEMVGIGAGIVVGILWAVTAPAGNGALGTALGELAPWALALWVLIRVLGTSIIVPIVEEALFRGYILLDWLDGPGWPRKAFAIAASTLPFAFLHGRLLAAGLAGLVFALVALRRGKVSDAIWAHAIANLIVAIWALAMGDFTMI